MDQQHRKSNVPPSGDCHGENQSSGPIFKNLTDVSMNKELDDLGDYVYPGKMSLDHSPFASDVYQCSPDIVKSVGITTPKNKLTFDHLTKTPNSLRDVIVSDENQNVFNTPESNTNYISLFSGRILKGQASCQNNLPSKQQQPNNGDSNSRRQTNAFSKDPNYASSSALLDRQELSSGNQGQTTCDGFLNDKNADTRKRKVVVSKNLFNKRSHSESFELEDVFRELTSDSMPPATSDETAQEPRFLLNRFHSMPSYTGDISSKCPKPMVANLGKKKCKARNMPGDHMLVGNQCRFHSIPGVFIGDKGFPRVPCETVASLITGAHPMSRRAILVDCRFPYEYDGGHIDGAVNLFTKENILNYFFRRPSPLVFKENSDGTLGSIIILHCEFSSHRAPGLAKFIRETDRQIHAECYPMLFFPEIYVMDGGYKSFFSSHSSLCVPRQYVTMDDQRFAEMGVFYSKLSKICCDVDARSIFRT